MGRVSWNIADMFELAGHTGPFGVFAEIAVLGLKNQPVYYEDISHRIPLMFGVNLPGFRLFDLISLQFEYFKNPYSDNDQNVFNEKLALPSYLQDFDYRDFRQASVHDRDDWKWSLHLSRTVVPGLKVAVQVANDHFRLRHWDTQPGTRPLTNKPGHFYYLARLQWGF
jgi:hypothetical protein